MYAIKNKIKWTDPDIHRPRYTDIHNADVQKMKISTTPHILFLLIFISHPSI